MIGGEIVIPATDQIPESKAYAALPPEPTRGVVIIHEILGPRPEINRVAERFAMRGYAAVAPALFQSILNPTCIRRAMLTLRTGTGPYVEQLLQARRWLCAETGVAEANVGIIGFCIGGGFALAAGRGWGAVSTNYGDIPSAEVLRGIGPVIGCYGGRDRAFGHNDVLLRKRLAPEATVETHSFPTVGHSFLTDGSPSFMKTLSWPIMHITYDPAVAEEGWDRIMTFFDHHLT